MEDWTLNWTGWILRNTHAEIKGLTYEKDFVEWIQVMFELWKNNSDLGWKYQEQQKQAKQ